MDAHPDSAVGGGYPPLRRLVHEDWQAHWRELSRPGFQALAVYRLGHRAQQAPGITGALLRWLSRVLAAVVRRRFDIDLDPAARLGRRVIIGHQGGIVVKGCAVVGDDCILLQGTKIGCFGAAADRDAGPRIGDRVRFGARAVVDGPVRVGDDARIGPNAVVTTDVGPNVVAIAPTTKLLRRER